MDIVTRLHPRLVVSDAAGAIDFYVRALGAAETGERHTDDAGRIAHAALTIGDTVVHLKDEGDGDPSPATLGGTPVILSLEVTDARAVEQRLLDAGARSVFPVSDHGYGYLDGRLADPYGHLWLVSQRL
jgi:PhnB protein